MDSSGYVCNNKWNIQGAWYCYTDGSDSSNSCGGSTKGTNVIPWNKTSNGMCLTGTMGAGAGKYAGIGFKVNSGPPGTAPFSAWNASTNNIVGFAVTFASGSTGRGTNGMVLNIEYPTTGDLDPSTQDAPGITVPGVGGTSITYNALFSDAVQANNTLHAETVDPTTLTDLKVAFFPDSVSHTYDFCITKIVPLTAAPSPEVGTGNYGPTFNNQTAQAINGVNGYAVQSAPFNPTNGVAMSMQVTGGTTAGHVGFVYSPGSGFGPYNNGPGSFPAIISGWGPGSGGIQYYGPYKGGKTIGGTSNALKSVATTWSFTTSAGNGDAAYDVWFSNVSANPAQAGIEFMVWFNRGGKSPLGTAQNSTLVVNGTTWTPSVGTNPTNEQVVSYVPSTDANTANVDLLTFFKDAASHGYAGISNNSYLLGVQAGFEAYGGTTWTTSDYTISIQ